MANVNRSARLRRGVVGFAGKHGVDAAQQATEFAIGPIESSDGASGTEPASGTRRWVGLNR
jgi:hypothetical protein